MAKSVEVEAKKAECDAMVPKLEEEKGKFGSFCARPVPKVIGDNSKVYTPRRSSKPLTEVHDFQLNVDRRSQTHQQLSDRKAARERKMEAEKAAEEARRKEEEAREIRNMRRSMVCLSSLFSPTPLSLNLKLIVSWESSLLFAAVTNS